MTSTPSHYNGSEERRAWPIYILSSLRSGSTLLRYLLDAHERLACPPETKFIAGFVPFLEYPQSRLAFESLGVSHAEVFEELRLFVERIMGRYTSRHNKSRWVDKTPNYYRYTHIIEQLFQEQVLYVILARHPFDCICSLEAFQELTSRSRDPEVARLAATHGYGRYAWAQYWHEVYSRLALFSASRPDRTLIVTYEDLVSCPDVPVARICEFIAEPYDPTIVTRAFSTEHAQGFGDSKIDQTERVHTNSVGQWRRWPRAESETLWECVRGPATHFGYDVAETVTLPVGGSQQGTHVGA